MLKKTKNEICKASEEMKKNLSAGQQAIHYILRKSSSYDTLAVQHNTV